MLPPGTIVVADLDHWIPEYCSQGQAMIIIGQSEWMNEQPERTLPWLGMFSVLLPTGNVIDVLLRMAGHAVPNKDYNVKWGLPVWVMRFKQ